MKTYIKRVKVGVVAGGHGYFADFAQGRALNVMDQCVLC